MNCRSPEEYLHAMFHMNTMAYVLDHCLSIYIGLLVQSSWHLLLDFNPSYDQEGQGSLNPKPYRVTHINWLWHGITDFPHCCLGANPNNNGSCVPHRYNSALHMCAVKPLDESLNIISSNSKSESLIKVNNSFQEAENEFSIIPGISTILLKTQSNDSWIHHQEVTLKSTTACCKFSPSTHGSHTKERTIAIITRSRTYWEKYTSLILVHCLQHWCSVQSLCNWATLSCKSNPKSKTLYSAT